MSRQAPLFALPPKPRVIRMHVIDAGQADGAPHLASFRCDRCGYETGWVAIANVTEGRRGLPCPTCNPTPTHPRPALEMPDGE